MYNIVIIIIQCHDVYCIDCGILMISSYCKLTSVRVAKCGCFTSQ